MANPQDHFSVKAFKEELNANSISLAFQGVFTHDILSLIGHSLRDAPNNQIISKRLFAIAIEMAQNIHHYSAEKVYSEKDSRKIGIGIIAIGEDYKHHLISSGNYIESKDIENIIERSDFINQLDADELKEYYRAQRKAPQRKDKPGANLGFIDMVRKSGNPVEITIKDSKDEKSFFILTVRVNKEI